MIVCKSCGVEISKMTDEMLETSCVSCFKELVSKKCYDSATCHKRKARLARNYLRAGKMTKEELNERREIWNSMMEFVASCNPNYKSYTGTQTQKSVKAFFKVNHPLPSEEFMMDLDDEIYEQWNDTYCEVMEFLEAHLDDGWIKPLVYSIDNATAPRFTQNIAEFLGNDALEQDKVASVLAKRIREDDGSALNELADLAGFLPCQKAVKALLKRVLTDDFPDAQNLSHFAVVTSLIKGMAETEVPVGKNGKKLLELIHRFVAGSPLELLKCLRILGEKLGVKAALAQAEELAPQLAEQIEALKKMGIHA